MKHVRLQRVKRRDTQHYKYYKSRVEDTTAKAPTRVKKMKKGINDQEKKKS